MMARDPNEMSFLEHLEELRWRLVRAIVAVMVVAIAAFIAKGFVFDTIIMGPRRAGFPTYRFFCKISQWLGLNDTLCLTSDFTLQNIAMAGQFTSHLVVSIVAGIIVAFPYIFYQLWKFVAPGLKDGEKSAATGVVAVCSALFLVGVLFGYYLIAPLSVQFLGNYSVSNDVANQIALNSYISTVTTVSLSCGLVFQLPLVVYFLARLGLVTPEGLKAYRKHAVVGVLVLSAIITPPDVTSQILVSLPLMFLYEVSIVIARRVTRKAAKNQSTR